MALTYGFYDSLNHDRVYSANQMSTIFNGIITDGVFMNIGEHFSVVAGTGMQVIVKPGRAWFDGTWTLLDTDYPLNIGAVSTLLGRIDAIVLETNFDVETRANTIKVVAGTPSATPVKPTLTNTDLVKQHILAYVTIPANTTSIDNSMIDIQVGVKKETPYITSVLQSTDISLLYLKWEDEWYKWFNDVKSTLSGDVAANLKADIDQVSQDLTNILDLNVWDQTMVVTTQSKDGQFVDDGTVAEYFGITRGSTYVDGYTESDLIVHIPVAVYKYSSSAPYNLYMFDDANDLAYPLYNPDGTIRSSNNYVYIANIRNATASTINAAAANISNGVLALYDLYTNNSDESRSIPCLEGFYNGSNPRYFYIPEGLTLADVFVRPISGSTTGSYYAYNLPYTNYSSNEHAVIWLNDVAERLVVNDDMTSTSSYARYTFCWVVRADKLRVGHYESASIEQHVVTERKTSFNPEEYTEIRPGGAGAIDHRPVSADTTILQYKLDNNLTRHMPIVYVQGVDITSVDNSGILRTEIMLSYLVDPYSDELAGVVNHIRSAGCPYISFVPLTILPTGYSYIRGSYSMFVMNDTFAVKCTTAGLSAYVYALKLSADAINVYGVGSIDGLTRTKRGVLGDYDNVQWGTYYGTDTCGPDAPCVITFRRRPKIFMMLGFYVVDQDRLTAMPSNADIKPWVALEYCPSEYTMGYGPSMMNATGSFGRYDEENNVYMWYDDTPFGQYNAGPVAFSDDPVMYNAKYYWIAFG